MPYGVRSGKRSRRRGSLRWRGSAFSQAPRGPFALPDPQKQGSRPSLQLPGSPARAAPRVCVMPAAAPFPCHREARGGGGGGGSRLLEAPAVTATPSPVGWLGPLDVSFRSLPLPPSLRRRGCALRRGSRETPPPPRSPRPSPLHARTH